MDKELMEAMLRAVPGSAVQQRPRAGSYLEGWYVIAKLDHYFTPFGWSKRVNKLWLIYDEAVEWVKDGQTKHGFDVCYGAEVSLVIGDSVHEDVGTGLASHSPGRGEAHDQAAKTAVTDGLKRCAKDLGDPFGLSLYNNGSIAPVVRSYLDATR